MARKTNDEVLATRVEHVRELSAVLMEALRQAGESFPDFADDIYIVKFEVDGQYHTVTVGIANQVDFQTIIDISSPLVKLGVLALKLREAQGAEAQLPIVLEMQELMRSV